MRGSCTWSADTVTALPQEKGMPLRDTALSAPARRTREGRGSFVAGKGSHGGGGQAAIEAQSSTLAFGRDPQRLFPAQICLSAAERGKVGPSVPWPAARGRARATVLKRTGTTRHNRAQGAQCHGRGERGERGRGAAQLVAEEIPAGRARACARGRAANEAGAAGRETWLRPGPCRVRGRTSLAGLRGQRGSPEQSR